MVIGLPWNSTLGAVRPQFEVASELRQRGHEVDHFTLENAFGSQQHTRFHALLGPRFARIAARRIARIATRYDVIDANEGHLAASKAQLGFDGLLVARSNGLMGFYRSWEHEARRRWPEDVGRYRTARALRALRARAVNRDVSCSHRNADVFVVLNKTELDAIDGEQLDAESAIVLHGVSTDYLAASAPLARRPGRLGECVVSCVGTWDRRKGARDWPAIFTTVLEHVPQARFAFIGTGVPSDVVRAALGAAATPERVSIVPRFMPGELPALLASSAVGALPSYIEGFGLAVLEQFAAGIPCVVYDNPGTRASTAPLTDDYRTAPGDTNAFAAQLVKVLTLEERAYREVVGTVREFAEQHTWAHTATATLALYTAGLERLGRTAA